MKELIQELFPDGEFITFDDICVGDTIVRGGATLYDNEPLNSCVHMGKVIEIKSDNHQDDRITCYTDVRSFSSEIAHEELTNAWYYRVPVIVKDEIPTITTHNWVNTIISKYIASVPNLEKVNYNDIKAGDILFTADSEEGDSTDDAFLPDIYIGEAFEEDEYGWGIPPYPNGDPHSFTLVLKPDTDTPHIYRINV